jgi:hypothetical protein
MLKLDIDGARKSDHCFYKFFVPLGILSFPSNFFWL